MRLTLLANLANVVLAASLFVSAPIHTGASEPAHRLNNQPQSSCEVLRDAFVWSLFKPIGIVLRQYNDERQFMVDDVVEVKRLKQGQYYWETTLKVTTFEGPHNPPYHKYIITFTNLFSNEVKVKKVLRTD
ncbi:DUF3888 domain-containing protein [Paenibacillus chitinolyticus]|uniref:DUF3888 domain-containing protein n=1 Tax=Paenibacillus chitinolyticus TaxID=79263 RepID=A0ABT4FIM3_9BACL|nr:DUF3888 domain-containing protein [Paenibacillus chitinolyticus]MCY9589657.1 DUF3888 domain-containing protein [Paenibacillus chitinolyticus]MCY9598343.1 DUF3888 domain-containing protein [Paenibacillus chitinolyticus]